MSASIRLVRTWRRPAAAAVVFTLAGCGGGGDGGGGIDPGAARDLTGARPPVETPAAQNARAAGILSRSDSLILSTIHEETRSRAPLEFQFRTDGDEARARSYEVTTECAGAQCNWTRPGTAAVVETPLRYLAFLPGAAAAILTKGGISLVEGRGSAAPVIDVARVAPVTGTVEGAWAESLGAWMNHGWFAVQQEGAQIGNYDVTARYAIAGGALTPGGPPGVSALSDVSASWTGLMAGAPRGGNFRDSILQGDARLTLTYAGNDPRLGAVFSNIVDLRKGTAYATSEARFDNILLTDGTYRAGIAGNRIQGGFYGPNHVETAGIFEQAGITGAFGAKRDPAPRASTVFVSTIHGSTNTLKFPDFEVLPVCSGAACRWRIPGTAADEVVGLEHLDLAPDTAGETETLARHGIGIYKGRGEPRRDTEDDVEIEYYIARTGTGMEHASFAFAQGMWNRADNIEIIGRFGIAGGSRLSSVPLRSPGISARWSGLMVGAPKGGGYRGNVLVGNAALTYNYSDASPTLDAEFSSIENVEQGKAHSPSSMQFDDVPVARDGSYRKGEVGNRIHGGFFGPGHDEAAGAFEQHGIVAAFGAKRESGVFVTAIQGKRFSDSGILPVCLDTQCRWLIPGSEISGIVAREHLEVAPVSSEESVFPRDGVEIVRGRGDLAIEITSGRGELDDSKVEYYRARMDSASFSLAQAAWGSAGDADVTGRFGIAGGDATGAPLGDMSASWSGLMVGAPRDGALHDNVLVGDADLAYTYSADTGGMIDAAFSNIENAREGAAHSTRSVRFDDVPVAPDGSYRKGEIGDRIHGGFFGPNHEEAAGVFERSGIVGAFGAKPAPAIFATSIHGDMFPDPGVLPLCIDTECRWRTPNDGGFMSFALRHMNTEPDSSGETRIFEKEGIEIAKGSGKVGDASIEYYRARMSDVSFSLAQAMWDRAGDDDPTGRFGAAGAERLTGTPPGMPPMSASWSGVMVGAPRDGAFHDNVLVGDAELTYNYSDMGGTVAATFSNIVDLERRVAHSTPNVRFDDVPVSPNGSYRMGTSGDRIMGGFFGLSHDETAGVFEKEGIVGAFGARRDE